MISINTRYLLYYISFLWLFLTIPIGMARGESPDLEAVFRELDAESALVVGLGSFDEAQKSLRVGLIDDCVDRSYTASLAQNVVINGHNGKKEEVECFCDIDKLNSDEKKAVILFIGKIQEQSIKVDTGNDNFGHGILHATRLFQYDGDDRGRTFSFDVQYRAKGKKGEFNLSVGSTGFGEFAKVEDKRKDDLRRYYLKFREYNNVSLELNKFPKSDNSNKLYWTNEISFFNETDNGNLSRSIQDKYHGFAKEVLGVDVIQYNYVKNEEDRNTLSALTGIGKEIYFDIKNWKCRFRAELKAGIAQELKGGSNTFLALNGKFEFELSHSSAPWIALSTWLEASRNHLGDQVSYNTTLKGKGKIKEIKVEPFIGTEKHFSDVDTKFDNPSGRHNEIFHKLGVTFRF